MKENTRTPQREVPSTDTVVRLLRLPDVMRITGLRRSSIYDMVRAGTFPQAIPLTKVARAWSEAEVQEWIASRIAARDEAAA